MAEDANTPKPAFELPPFNPDPSPTLETEEAGIDQCTRGGASMRWRRGVHYRRVVDGKLWSKDPNHRYSSLAAWGKKRYGKSLSALKEDASVSRAFEEAVALLYEFTCLVLFIVWANLKKLSPLPKDPGGTLIPIPSAKGTVEKPFRECSSIDLRRAIRALKPPKTQELPPEEAERMTRFRAALEGVLPPGTPFPVKVAIKKGQASYAIAPLPGDLFDAVMVAISKAWAAVPVTPTQPADRLEAHNAEMQAKMLATARDPATVEKLKQQMAASMGLLRKALSVPPPPGVQVPPEPAVQAPMAPKS